MENFSGTDEAAVHFFEVGYTTAVKGLPHSKHFAFNRDVINPQDGHILCDPYPATCGFSLRIQRSSRIVNSTISRPREILAMLIKATLLGESCTNPDEQTTHSQKSLRWKNFRWTGLGQKT
jgi:hypothetical protein